MAEKVKRNKGNRLISYVSDYVVFDLETTGISTNKDAIIEISAVKAKNGVVVDTFDTLVNPERHIPSVATAVNGITDEMVKDAPVLSEVLPMFLDFIGDMVLVGHNIHSFDTSFIYDAVLAQYEREFQNDYIDTLYMARKCLPKLSHHRLVDISDYFGFSTEGAHRALNDCIMNQKCYEELGKIQKEILPMEEEITCVLCGGKMVRRAGKFGEFYGCLNFPACRHTEKIKK